MVGRCECGRGFRGAIEISRPDDRSYFGDAIERCSAKGTKIEDAGGWRGAERPICASLRITGRITLPNIKGCPHTSGFSLDLYCPIVPRDLDLGEPLVPRAGSLVKVVSGMRRYGKSYRLFQEIERLESLGVPASRICYFNFDDDRLKPATSARGDEVLERSTSFISTRYPIGRISFSTHCRKWKTGAHGFAVSSLHIR